MVGRRGSRGNRRRTVPTLRSAIRDLGSLKVQVLHDWRRNGAALVVLILDVEIDRETIALIGSGSVIICAEGRPGGRGVPFEDDGLAQGLTPPG